MSSAAYGNTDKKYMISSKKKVKVLAEHHLGLLYIQMKTKPFTDEAENHVSTRFYLRLPGQFILFLSSMILMALLHILCLFFYT